MQNSLNDSLSKRPYRPCVGIALFNKNGNVFVGERIDTPGAWQMPQGGIDPGEDLEGAAFRELMEEIGTNKAKICEIMDGTVRYDLPLHLIDTLWNGQYRGQEQYWIAMKFTGSDEDIVLNGDERPEFSKWKWADLKDVPNMIVPFKKDVYEQVIRAFSDIKIKY